MELVNPFPDLKPFWLIKSCFYLFQAQKPFFKGTNSWYYLYGSLIPMLSHWHLFFSPFFESQLDSWYVYLEIFWKLQKTMNIPIKEPEKDQKVKEHEENDHETWGNHFNLSIFGAFDFFWILYYVMRKFSFFDYSWKQILISKLNSSIISIS